MDSTTMKIQPEPPASRSLWFALQVGLPVKMSYTLVQTALYSGLSEYQLRMAIADGELTAKAARGTMRGARIPVASMDAYMAG